MRKVITTVMILAFMTLISGCFPPGQLNSGNGNGQSQHQLDRSSMMPQGGGPGGH